MVGVRPGRITGKDEGAFCDRLDRHTHTLKYSHSPAVADHPLWPRRIRNQLLVVVCLVVALVWALLSTSQSRTIGEATEMAPPAGYSADQVIFDDQFTGTSINSDHWNTVVGGQGDPIWNSGGLPAGDSAAGTRVHQTYFSPSQVTVNNGLTLTMVPDTKHASLGYGYRSGVVTSRDEIHTQKRLRSDQGQDVRSVSGRLACHLVHRPQPRRGQSRDRPTGGRVYPGRCRSTG